MSNRFTIHELLEQAERLAALAVEESAEDDSAILLNAAGKGWNAANLSMLAVIGHLTQHRPNGTDTRRRKLEELSNRFPRSRLSDFRGLVDAAFSDLHLRAEEQADYATKVLRRRVLEVSTKLVPLAREIVTRGSIPKGRYTR